MSFFDSTLPLSLSPATHAAARVSATTSVVGLVKRLSTTSLRGFPHRQAQHFQRSRHPLSPVRHGATRDRAEVNGRLVPFRLTTVWSSLTNVVNAALRAVLPVWRTILTPWLRWLAGLYPEYLLDRERARWKSRVEILPANHPLLVRLARPPYCG
jgi:hypothetical protein